MGQAFPKDEVVENLVTYAQETRRNGGTLGNDSIVQQATMDSYLGAHANSLLAKRTYWMYQSRMEVSYVANVHSRESGQCIAIRVREVMNMDALLGAEEPKAPHGGAQEVAQRFRAGQGHGAESTNVAKVVLARRIGISRTKERPAPTPATATSFGS